MRRARSNQPTFDFMPMDDETGIDLEMMGRILDALGDGILRRVKADLTRGVDAQDGRPGMSAEQVLRVAIVKLLHEWSYERLFVRLDDSRMLRTFCDYEYERIPKPSTLQENIKKLSPETMKALLKGIVLFAREKGLENGKAVRIDCAGTETNIHHPTDSSLIVDGVRVVTRILRDVRREFSEAVFDFRDHTRVVKKRAFSIANAKHAQKRLSAYRDMVAYASKTVAYGKEALVALRLLPADDDEKKLIAIVSEQLEHRVRLLERVIDQTRRRVFEGEKVPASEKVVSLFEEHTDIIEKGGRETLFGHKVLFTAGKHIVLDCMVLKGNPADATLYPEALDRQIALFGFPPDSTSADGGFASKANAEYSLERGVKQPFFSKRVGAFLRTLVPSQWLRRKLYRFRAGIEGILSTLQRCVGLARCLWEGWESFQAYVFGCVAAYNLKTLARLLVGREERRAKAASSSVPITC